MQARAGQAGAKGNLNVCWCIDKETSCSAVTAMVDKGCSSIRSCLREAPGLSDDPRLTIVEPRVRWVPRPSRMASTSPKAESASRLFGSRRLANSKGLNLKGPGSTNSS